MLDPCRPQRINGLPCPRSLSCSSPSATKVAYNHLERSFSTSDILTVILYVTVAPANAIGWTGKAPGVFVIHNWILTGSDNRTLVEVEESMEGLLTSLFRKSFNRKLENGMQKMLELLKEKCEK